jgi:hypothetical protein
MQRTRAEKIRRGQRLTENRTGMTMHRFALAFSSALLALALACDPGSKSVSGTATADDDGTITDSAGDGQSTTGGSPGTATGEDGRTDGVEDDPCAAIRPDDGEPQPVAITLRNDRAEPIFVGFGNECVIEAYEVTTESGTALQTIGPICSQSCADVIDMGCSSVDCGACGGPEMVRLEPGGSWELEWSGFVRPGLAIPAECASGLACSSGCATRRLPDPGAHTVRSIAFSSCTNDDGQPCEPCAAGETACTVLAGFESDFSQPDFMAEAALEIPSTQAVELVFSAD